MYVCMYVVIGKLRLLLSRSCVANGILQASADEYYICVCMLSCVHISIYTCMHRVYKPNKKHVQIL
jgi:hypothetical protein